MTTPAIPLANVPISTSSGQITLPWQRFFLSILNNGGSINAVVNGKTVSVSAIDIGAGLSGTVSGQNLMLTSGLSITENGETLEQISSLTLKGNFGLSGADGAATITAPDGAVQIAAYGVIVNEAAAILNFKGNVVVNSVDDEVYISVGAPIIQNGGTSIGSATTFNVTPPLTTSILGNVATTGFAGISTQQGTASLGGFIDLDIGAGLVGSIGTGSLAGTLSLANAGVLSLSGTSGAITLGSNLSLSGQTLNATGGGTLQAIEGTSTVSVGALHAGANIAFSGTSPNLTIAASSTASANITVENQGTSIGTVGTINAVSPVTASVAGGIASFTSTGGGSAGGLWGSIISAPSFGSFDLGWLNQGSAAYSTLSAGGLNISDPGGTSGYSFKLLAKTPPTPPYKMKLLVVENFVANNNTSLIVGWVTQGTQNYEFVVLQPPNYWVHYFGTSLNALGGYETLIGPPIGAGIPKWIELSDDGTNIIFAYCPDGDNPIPFFSSSKAAGHLGASGYNSLVFGYMPYGASIGSASLLSLGTL